MKAGGRLKRDIFWNVQCPICGKKNTSILVGTRTAYFRFYCGECPYEFECVANPTKRGIEVVNGEI